MSAKEIKGNLNIKEDPKQIYVTGVMGGFTPYDFKIALFNDKIVGSDSPEGTEIIRESEYQLVMSPIAAKQFSEWFYNTVKEYENDNGPIISEIIDENPKKK